jgi:signal transduction histidine kinase
MKKYITYCFILLIQIASIAQEPVDKMNDLMLKILRAADSCQTTKTEDCSLIYHKLIRMGQSEKYEHLDFLYYKLTNYYFKNHSQDSALYYAHKGLKIAKDKNSKESLLNIKASILYDQGKTDSAIHYFIKLADELEKNKEETKLAYTLANIGILLGSQDNNEKSVDYLYKSYFLLEKLEDSLYIGTIAGNLAFGYYFLGDYENSKKWVHKTINLNSSPLNDDGKIISYNTLAKIHLKKENDSAVYYSKKGVDLSRKSNNLNQLGNNLSTYADALIQKNLYKEAQIAIEEAVDVFREINFVPGLSDGLYVAGEISLKNNNYKKAANYLYESRQIRDSILSEKRIAIVNELNTKYETEKNERLLAEKELEIEKQENKNRTILFSSSILVLLILGLLAFFRIKQKNKLQQIQKEKENAVLNSFINGEERERVRISQELHDGLAALVSAAKMSLEALPHLDESSRDIQVNKTKSILENTHAEIRQIAHNLMPITLEKEGLIKATEQFVNDLHQTGIINLQFINKTSESPKLTPQIQLMLYRVIQELVNNIIKHSQANQAIVTFYTSENHVLKIEVTDDGIGFDQEDSKDSQGLFSIKQRLNAIGGNFTLKRNKQSGMQAIAELKLK